MTCDAILVNYNFVDSPANLYDLTFNKTYEDDNIIIYSGSTTLRDEIAKGRFDAIASLFDYSISDPSMCSPTYGGRGDWSFVGSLIFYKKTGSPMTAPYSQKVVWTTTNYGGHTITSTWYDPYGSPDCLDYSAGCKIINLQLKQTCSESTTPLPQQQCKLCSKCKNNLTLNCYNKCADNLTLPNSISVTVNNADLNLPVRLGTHPTFWIDTPTGIDMYNGTYILTKYDSGGHQLLSNPIFSTTAPYYYGSFILGNRNTIFGNYNFKIELLLYITKDFFNNLGLVCPATCAPKLEISLLHPGILDSFIRHSTKPTNIIIHINYNSMVGQFANLNFINLVYNAGTSPYNNVCKPNCLSDLTPLG